MTHDARQSVPAARPGTSLFVSGTVLGVALGIGVGHLLLFARSSPHSMATAEEEFAQLVSSTPRFAAVDGPLDDQDSCSSILEFDGREDVGRVRLSDQSDDNDGLHFFPEAMHAPGIESVDRVAAAPPGASVTTGPLQMTADTSDAGEPPPQALQPSPTASPIDKATSDRQEMARTIIRDEMPDASAQEREIWLEVLQGLPAEDIKGILRMRKHIGPGAALEPCPPLWLPAPQSDMAGGASDSSAVSRALAEESDVARCLRQITRHNLANRYTVAFKQQIPVLVEAADDDPAGIAITRVVRDMRPGELEETGRSLDIAIDGPEFLQVRRGDDVRYTRDGRLTLNEQGRLKLLGPADDWLIDPPVTVPGDAMHLAISETGEVSAVLADESTTTLAVLRIVQFLDPTALTGGEEGLYQETTASGTPHEPPSGPHVIPKHLERSNVSVPTEHTSPLARAAAAGR